MGTSKIIGLIIAAIVVIYVMSNYNKKDNKK